MRKLSFNCCCILLISVFLMSCSSMKKEDSALPKRKNNSNSELTVKPPVAANKEIDRIINKARKIFNQQPEKAKIILLNLDFEELDIDQKTHIALLLAKVAIQLTQYKEAMYWLDGTFLTSNQDLSLKQRVDLLKAQVLYAQNDYEQALRFWFSAFDLMDLTRRRSQDYSLFWKTLMSVSFDHLNFLDSQSPSFFIKPWINLAILFHLTESSEVMIARLVEWTQRWPDHIAKQFLPKNLDILSKNSTYVPKKIALMLPTSGTLKKAGESIRDGFMTRYYHNRSLNMDMPEIYMFDTNMFNMQNLVDKAVSLGVELIIGPLEKNKVEELKKIKPKNISALTLNVLPKKMEYFNGKGDFYQFGLSPEYEAQLVADKAYFEGYRKALVLNSVKSWSQRAAKSFIKRWEALGGNVVDQVQFNKHSNYSYLIQKVLHVKESNIRAKKLEKKLKTSLNYTPRIRGDVDMIFMPVPSEEGRQIHPALAYQYAGGVTTFSTSNVYMGDVAVQRDRDLNDIITPIMPWDSPSNQSVFKKKLRALWKNAKPPFGRLFALGADAYYLYPRLLQLKSLQGSHIDGLTGELSIDLDGYVNRKLIWHIFKNGKIQPIKNKVKF